MLRKVAVGSGLLALMPALPAVHAATPIEPKKVPTKPPPMKPSDLPIYESPHAEYAEYLESKEHAGKVSYLRGLILEPVRAVRIQAQAVLSQTDSATKAVRDQWTELEDRTAWIVNYLREEENKEVRYGAVAMGGLTGFIFGLRGGIIRRVLYTGVGTTAMGTVCFPEETSEALANNSALVRQYVNIAYNFLYGVKPGDPQLEIKFPDLSFPKTFSEFVDLAASVGTTVKQAVMPPPTKEVDQPAEGKKDKKA